MAIEELIAGYEGRKFKDWVFHLRRCNNRDTLDKVAVLIERRISGEALHEFHRALDHRMAELVAGKFLDKIPAHLWRYVK